ncbi:MAG: HEAT repeat domain-containing protein [Chromatiales bacterium]
MWESLLDSDRWLLSELPRLSQGFALASIALFVVTLGMILSVILIRVRVLWSALRERRLARHWDPVLIAAAGGADVSPPRLSRSDRKRVLKIWCTVSGHVAGEALERLNAVARQCGLERFVLTILRPKLLPFADHSPAICLYAIQAAERLRLTTAWNALERLAAKGQAPLDRYAARAMVALDARRAAPAIVPVLVRQGRWARHLVEELAEAGVARSIDAYADILSNAAEEAVPGLALLLERCGDPSVSSAVRRRLKDPRITDPDALAALLHALSVIGEAGDHGFVEPFISHELWYVRMRAAQALGHCGDWRDAGLLESLLCDVNWYVRYHAARTMARMEGIGVDGLRTIQGRITDRYARDMIIHVIAEVEAPAVRA